mmetsp:Transcript_5541/g.17743  ORF Transcript_5541/g.17743 Transcript_5541/m.17743 type:complete len:85 (+) Transcript_5541:324-578(+)
MQPWQAQMNSSPPPCSRWPGPYAPTSLPSLIVAGLTGHDLAIEQFLLLTLADSFYSFGSSSSYSAFALAWPPRVAKWTPGYGGK